MVVTRTFRGVGGRKPADSCPEEGAGASMVALHDAEEEAARRDPRPQTLCSARPDTAAIIQ